jgi:hypothetical protein
VGSCGLKSSGQGQGLLAGSCECGNEPLGSVRGGEGLLHAVGWLVGWLL